MEPTLNIKLTIRGADMVLKALAQRPYAEVAALIADVERQAKEQLKPEPAPAPDPQPEADE